MKYLKRLNSEVIDAETMLDAIDETSPETQEEIENVLKLMEKTLKKKGVKGFGQYSAIELLCALIRIGAITR